MNSAKGKINPFSQIAAAVEHIVLFYVYESLNAPNICNVVYFMVGSTISTSLGVAPHKAMGGRG